MDYKKERVECFYMFLVLCQSLKNFGKVLSNVLRLRKFEQNIS